MDLSQSTILVTGATAGFGQACAERFHRDGAKLIIAGRREQRLTALAKRLGGRVHPLVLDVRDRRAIERAVETLPAAFGEVDVLVNNAGLALGLDPAQRASLDDWEQMIDTNCRGLVVLTRLVLPGMVKRNRGHVVNIGSIAGSYPYACGNVYGATKAFVRQFSLGLRSDLLGTAVRVSNIEPGMAETEFSLVRLQDADKAKKVYQGMQPLTAQDIAETVYWCVTQPPHVNINSVEIMPVAQAFAGFTVDRK